MTVLSGLEVVRPVAMKPLHRVGVIVTATSVAVSFLTVCVPGLGAAQATGSGGPMTATGSAAWAYGAVISKSGTGAFGIYHYRASETVGFASVLRETNESGGFLDLQVNRTMGVLLSVEYCVPTCGSPRATATVTFHAWETDLATLNLTTAGTVLVGTTSTPALALVSSNESVTFGLRESATIVEHGSVAYSANISVNLNASATVAFLPPLGLVPLALAPGTVETWTAASTYTESGAANWSVLATGNLSADRTGNLSLTDTGAVSVVGTYGGATIRLGGATYDVLGLSVVGPFVLREGFLLIPAGSDVLGATAPAWLSSAVSGSGSASVSQQYVDMSSSPSLGTHLGFEGSEVVWSSAASNPAAAEASVAGAVPAALPLAAAPNTTSVQGQPESVAQATTDQNCLATGVGCPTGTAPRGLLGVLVLAAAAAVVAVLVLVLVTERRRVPPPSYPNATLYPPGAGGGSPPGGVRRPGAPSPPPQDDPLGHLW